MRLLKSMIVVCAWLAFGGCATSPSKDPDVIRVEIHNLTRDPFYATLITTAPLFGFPITKDLVLEAREVRVFEVRRGSLPGEIILDITTGKGVTR